jgi:hypothetical protein
MDSLSSSVCRLLQQTNAGPALWTLSSLWSFIDSLSLFMDSLSSSVCRLLLQTNAGPFVNRAVNEETPIVTSNQHRNDSLFSYEISR